MKKISFTLLAFACLFSAFSQTRSTFENFTLAPNSQYDGVDQAGGFLSGAAYFYNYYDTAYGGYWGNGFAYSNVKDDTTAGFTNEFASAAVGGALSSDNYAVAYGGSNYPTISLRGFASGHQVYGFYVTNSTFAYLSMKNGDNFAKKFGGLTGTDPDWFRLTVKAWHNGAVINDSVDFYLADFRSADSTQDYILKSWKFVNLQSLGDVDSLFFQLGSTDNGSFGMNTPAYFCLDNFMTTDGAVIVSPPVALLDTVSTLYSDSVIVPILANDTVSNFLYSTVTLVSGPQISGAVAYLDASNNLVYIPQIGVRATDTLTYSYCDELNACSSARILVNVKGNVNTGIDESSVTSLQLYPNPAKSRITISSAALIESVSIMDISGREVTARTVAQHNATMDISALSAGIYTVISHTSAGIIAKRLIKE